MRPGWVFWSILAAAIIHVVEECRGGFLTWFPSISKFEITLREFAAVNTALVALCLAAAMTAERFLVFSLSIASLILINTCFHIVGTVFTKRYAPALGVLLSFLLGALWHVSPFALRFLYLTIKR